MTSTGKNTEAVKGESEQQFRHLMMERAQSKKAQNEASHVTDKSESKEEVLKQVVDAEEHVVVAAPPLTTVAKPSLRRSKWFLFLFLLVVVVLIAVGVPFIIRSSSSGGGRESNTLSNQTTPDPSSNNTDAAITPVSSGDTERPPTELPTQSSTPPPTKLPTARPTQSPTTLLSRPDVSNLSWQRLGQTLIGYKSLDYFGTSISLSRDASTVAVGATQWTTGVGYVSVYSRQQQQQDEWTKVGNDFVGTSSRDNFGVATCLNENGSILAIGAEYGDEGSSDAIHARVYKYDGSLWLPMGGDVKGEPGDRFGRSVSLSAAGDVLVVTSYRKDIDNDDTVSGYVRVFQYKSDSWQQLGQTILGQTQVNQFGMAVSLSSSGRVVGIGAYANDATENSIDDQVSAYRYNEASSRWEPMGAPVKGNDSDGMFGSAISLNDNGLIMAVGSPGNFMGVKGTVSVFAYESTLSSWVPLGQTLASEQDGSDFFGASVSVSSNGLVVAVASHLHNAKGLEKSGQVAVFRYNAETAEWEQAGGSMNGKTENAFFGSSVSLCGSGSVVAIGAYQSDANGERSGSATLYSLE